MKARFSQILKVASAAAMAVSAPVINAADMFLRIEGVEGESTDSKHKGEIEILSFSMGGSNTFDPANPTSTSRANLSQVNVMTTMSKASPVLNFACVSGRTFPTARLVLRKSGATTVEYYTLSLNNVVVSSFQQSGSSGGGVPTESFSLSFTFVEWSYTPQNPDGSLGAPVKTSFDLKALK